MLVFRVSQKFTRKCPTTGEPVEYDTGDIIAHPERLADVQGSEHRAFGHMISLPDDHHAVLPHLPEDHPARVAHMKAVEDGWDKKGREEDLRAQQAAAQAAAKAARAKPSEEPAETAA